MTFGQQALLEPEALRTVPDRGGHSCWWGVDAATERLNVGWAAAPGLDLEALRENNAVAWEDPDGIVRGVQSVRLAAPNENEGARLLVVEEQLMELVAAMGHAGIPMPCAIYLEHPAGEYPKPILYYTVGIAASTLTKAVTTRRGGFKPHTEFTTSGHWKLKATGTGSCPKYKTVGKNAKGKPKRQKLSLEEYRVMQWARMVGYKGLSWDDADALAMAECARREIAVRVG